jgi:flagellar biosynthesis protein FlhF
MQIKKFFAVSLPAAARDVRKVLGAEAVILSTRSLSTADKPVMINGMRATVEVTAACETPEAPSPAASPRVDRVDQSVPSRLASSRPSISFGSGSAPKTERKPAANRPVAPDTATERPLKRVFPEQAKTRSPLASDKSRQAAKQRASVLREQVFGGRTADFLAAYVESEQTQSRRPIVVGADYDASARGSKTNGPAAKSDFRPFATLNVVPSPTPARGSSPAPRSPKEAEATNSLKKLKLLREERMKAGEVGERRPASRPAEPPPWIEGPERARMIRRESEIAASRRPNEKPTPPSPPSDPNDATADAQSRNMRNILRELRALSAELTRERDESLPANSVAAPSGAPDGKGSRQPAESPIAARGDEARPNKWPKRDDWPRYAADKAKEPSEAAREDWEEINRSMPLSAELLQSRLREQGVEEALRQRIVSRMFFGASRVDAAPWAQAAPWAVRRETPLEEAEPGSFGQMVDVVKDFVPHRRPTRKETHGPRIIALVGPTGVGKTTTIAKIASRHSLKDNLKVALVTLDTYRVAAVDQLKTYARLLGAPIKVVTRENTLQDAFRRFESMDLILIDTPGSSPADRAAIQRLAASLGSHPEVEVHLVVPSNLREEETRRIFEAFKPVCHERVVFSKLDEATNYGCLLNSWIMGGLDVSYFTTGQRVPEDLENASVESLCRSLLGDALTGVAV